MKLADKIALITGNSIGIGHAIALGFAREGCSVAVADFKSSDAEECASKVTALGRDSLALQVDLTKGRAVEEMVQKVMTKFGRIDVLVNAAGRSNNGSFFERTEEQWDQTIAISLKSYFLCCQAVGKVMIKQKNGKIINVTSMVAKMGVTSGVMWSAARGGVNRRMMKMPLGRLGTPDDFVGPATFLASSDSDWVTGDVIYADGGETLGHPRKLVANDKGELVEERL